MTRPRGISLVEALVACSVFLGVLAVAVAAFDYALRGCLQGGTRADLQTQATRALASLQQDLRRSSEDSVRIESRQIPYEARLVHRDGLCFLGRADWTGPDNYSPTTGAALYDRYLSYYATTGGKLIRAVLDGPDPPQPGTTALDSYSLALYGNDNPGLNNSQRGYSVLAEQVREFAVTQLSSRRVQVRLHLTAPGARSPGGGRRTSTQSYEMFLELRPANTVGY